MQMLLQPGKQRTSLLLRRAILAELGVAPRLVRLLPPMWLVKSTAGKPARSTSRRKFLAENPGLFPGAEEAP